MPVKKGDDWGRGTMSLPEEDNDGAFKGDAAMDTSKGGGKASITDKVSHTTPKVDKPTAGN